MPEHVETSPSTTTIGPDRAAPRDQTFLIATVVACVVVSAGWAAYSLAPRWPPAPIDPLPTGSLFVGPSQINHHALAFIHVADTSRQKLAYRVIWERAAPTYPITRQRAGLWIASNRVEKFNDWSVSARCKHQGMEWTEAGVVALVTLEAAPRNGELPTWRAKHRLPAWKIPRGRKKVA